MMLQTTPPPGSCAVQPPPCFEWPPLPPVQVPGMQPVPTLGDAGLAILVVAVVAVVGFRFRVRRADWRGFDDFLDRIPSPFACAIIFAIGCVIWGTVFVLGGVAAAVTP